MLDQVTEPLLRTHMKFVSDDLLEGRAPGERGEELATAYVASHFRMAGLRPLPRLHFGIFADSNDTSDSFLHAVPLRALIAEPVPLFLEYPLGSINLTFADDYTSNSDLDQTYLCQL